MGTRHQPKGSMRHPHPACCSAERGWPGRVAGEGYNTRGRRQQAPQPCHTPPVPLQV